MASKFDNPNSFRTWGNDRITESTKRIAQVVESVVQEGAMTMREITMNQGTNNEWEKDWPSRAHGRKSGSTKARYDTGEMLNSIQSTMTDVSPTHVSGEFGWLYNQQDYFIYQDRGFNHYRKHEWIYGMEALGSAFTHAVYILKTRLSEAFK